MNVFTGQKMNGWQDTGSENRQMQNKIT